MSGILQVKFTFGHEKVTRKILTAAQRKNWRYEKRKRNLTEEIAEIQTFQLDELREKARHII